MRFVGDLHIHSKYARACSKNIDIKNLERYARLKGIDVLGTGDFQHPQWWKELQAGLTEEGGVLKTETGFPFIMQTEISLMYSQGGKGRRVHLLLYAPDMETATQITEALGKRGRLDYDGRPIFGFSCIELVEMMQEISKVIEIIPAHAWTPWFSVFGSKSGFDTLKECFQEKTKHIHAIETGLSSDPAMNARLSSLDGIQLVSFSDMHSFWPHRIGREVTVFDLEELSYMNILNAIRTGQGLKETLEVDPAYGKYHWDGHRNCNVVFPPAESVKNKKICPVCKKELTIGVEYRVEELADRPVGFKPDGAKPFRSLLPLTEIISFIVGGQVLSRKVVEEYHNLVKVFGTEFAVLLDVQKKELEKVTDKKVAKGIIDVREGKVTVKPGYDGVYGELVLGKKEEAKKQKGLLKFKKLKKLMRKKGGQKTLGDF